MINTEIFMQIGLDSGALTLLGAVAHPVHEPGPYWGVVLRDGEEVAGFGFVVAEEGRTQLDVDVAKVAGAGRTGAGRTGCGCCTDPDADPHLRAGGMLLVHVGSGRGAYAVVVSAGEGDARRVVFDSRQLEKGDLFTATVLRPGRYAVTNTVNGARAELEVRYPERRRESLRAAEPVQVRAGDRFDPERLTVQPTQGQVYAAETAARVVIELVEPYDGVPVEGGAPRFRLVARRPVAQAAGPGADATLPEG
jgi:hypothetical protein